MRKATYKVVPCLALSLALSASTAPKPNSTLKEPTQMAKRLSLKRTQTIRLDYLLFLPKGYNAKGAKRWPMILFLHGSGERGTNIWKVTKHGPPKEVSRNPDFPFILVSPQCPERQKWSTEVLLGLLDEITHAYAVDTNRIYLTGLSMGGYGTWELGLSYPEKFAAIAPICGGGELITMFFAGQDKGPALKSLGVWAFHGGKDPVVPVEESQRMVDALKKLGVRDVKLTIYPEAAHDSWTETYENPELYQWLLKHER